MNISPASPSSPLISPLASQNGLTTTPSTKFAGESRKFAPVTPDALDSALKQASSSGKASILLAYLDKEFPRINPRTNDPDAASFLSQRDQIVSQIGKEMLDGHFTPQIADTLIDLATIFPLFTAVENTGNKAYSDEVKTLLHKCRENTPNTIRPLNTFFTRQFILRHLVTLSARLLEFAQAY